MTFTRIPQILLAAIVLAATVQVAAAGTISVGWDPVSHPDLAGYRVYYGGSPGAYTGSVDVGNVTETTISGLTACTTYHLSVKALASDGTESDGFAQEISGWARPELDATTPAQVERNTQTAVVLDGANFQPGAQLLTANSGLIVDDLTVSTCSQLVVTLSVSADAALGPVDLTLVNPTQVFGQRSGLLTVVADATAPGISSLAAGSVGTTEATISWTTDEPATGEVFYRRSDESSWHTESSASATSHAVALEGLMDEATYEYRVEATDASGNMTASTTESFTTGSGPYTYLRIEAEMGGATAPLEIASSPGQSVFRGEWLQQAEGTFNGSPTSPNGIATYGFHVPQGGAWRVWLRLSGDSSTSNGWYERVNDAGFQGVSATADGAWHWVQGRAYQLDAGLHDLEIGGHESLARVDRILITDDPDFVPAEQPGADVTAPQQVQDPAVTAGDAANSLVWTDPTGGDAETLVIRYRTDGRFPMSPADGLPLVETEVAPGSPGGYDHTGLTNGTTYTYSVFTIDAAGNASDPVLIEATPSTAPPAPVTNLHRTDTL